MNQKPRLSLREIIYDVIFEADTPAGKAFDVILLWAIFLSIGAVLLESVDSYAQDYGAILRAVEWGFTVLFTVEYLIRIYSCPKPLSYIFSFYGLVDFLSILPTYLSLFYTGTQSLLVIRGLRLLRIFRVFKLGRYTNEAQTLVTALHASRAKITVFLGSVLGLVLIMGAAMYLIEGESSGFTSIPKAMYWAIVTMTTVGYGDIVPQTTAGQIVASMVMMSGYAIIAVPTGIVSVELANAERSTNPKRQCRKCKRLGHENDAAFCMICGEKLPKGRPRLKA